MLSFLSPIFRRSAFSAPLISLLPPLTLHFRAVAIRVISHCRAHSFYHYYQHSDGNTHIIIGGISLLSFSLFLMLQPSLIIIKAAHTGHSAITPIPWPSPRTAISRRHASWVIAAGQRRPSLGRSRADIASRTFWLLFRCPLLFRAIFHQRNTTRAPFLSRGLAVAAMPTTLAFTLFLRLCAHSALHIDQGAVLLAPAGAKI